MRILTSAQMLAVEKRASEELNLGVAHLMERAGKALSDEFRKLPAGKRKAIVACGKGNNGGDGFVVARLLKEVGYHVAVFHASTVDSFSDEASRAFKRLPEEVAIFSFERTGELERHLADADGVVDAIFGFGISGPVEGEAARVIELINGAGKPVVSADMPSGVIADTGETPGPCVKATVTVTFSAPKIGLVLYPGAAKAGRVVVADIGIPRSLVEEASDVRMSDPADLKKLIPGYSPVQNKWSRGSLLVVAGAPGMEGAAVLAARGAMRSGTGLVGMAVPAKTIPVISVGVLEAVKYPLPETASGSLSMKAATRIEEVASRFRAALIGPGLSRDEESMKLVKRLVSRLAIPVILDADGLFAYAGEAKALAKREGALVISPHAEELARLLGVTAEKIEADRLGSARRAAEITNAIVVLKGARSVIATPDGLAVNPTGNPGMATAGTGDVLSGIIGSLLAQGLSPEGASALGVYLHGLSGDIAIGSLTEHSLVAGDLVEYLPEAYKRMIAG